MATPSRLSLPRGARKKNIDLRDSESENDLELPNLIREEEPTTVRRKRKAVNTTMNPTSTPSTKVPKPNIPKKDLCSGLIKETIAKFGGKFTNIFVENFPNLLENLKGKGLPTAAVYVKDYDRQPSDFDETKHFEVGDAAFAMKDTTEKIGHGAYQFMDNHTTGEVNILETVRKFKSESKPDFGDDKKEFCKRTFNNLQNNQLYPNSYVGRTKMNNGIPCKELLIGNVLMNLHRVVCFMLSILPTAADYILEGITAPFFLIGSAGTFSPTHIEDAGLGSISVNYIGYKLWLIIDPAYNKTVERALWLTANKKKGLTSILWERLSKLAPIDLERRRTTCISILRHKSYVLTPDFLDKHNIPYWFIIQEPMTVVITSPGVYHGVVNLSGCVSTAKNVLFDYVPHLVTFTEHEICCPDMEPKYKDFISNLKTVARDRINQHALLAHDIITKAFSVFTSVLNFQGYPKSLLLQFHLPEHPSSVTDVTDQTVVLRNLNVEDSVKITLSKIVEPGNGKLEEENGTNSKDNSVVVLPSTSLIDEPNVADPPYVSETHASTSFPLEDSTVSNSTDINVVLTNLTRHEEPNVADSPSTFVTEHASVLLTEEETVSNSIDINVEPPLRPDDTAVSNSTDILAGLPLRPEEPIVADWSDISVEALSTPEETTVADLPNVSDETPTTMPVEPFVANPPDVSETPASTSLSGESNMANPPNESAAPASTSLSREPTVPVLIDISMASPSRPDTTKVVKKVGRPMRLRSRSRLLPIKQEPKMCVSENNMSFTLPIPGDSSATMTISVNLNEHLEKNFKKGEHFKEQYEKKKRPKKKEDHLKNKKTPKRRGRPPKATVADKSGLQKCPLAGCDYYARPHIIASHQFRPHPIRSHKERGSLKGQKNRLSISEQSASPAK